MRSYFIEVSREILAYGPAAVEQGKREGMERIKPDITTVCDIEVTYTENEIFQHWQRGGNEYYFFTTGDPRYPVIGIDGRWVLIKEDPF